MYDRETCFSIPFLGCYQIKLVQVSDLPIELLDPFKIILLTLPVVSLLKFHSYLLIPRVIWYWLGRCGTAVTRTPRDHGGLSPNTWDRIHAKGPWFTKSIHSGWRSPRTEGAILALAKSGSGLEFYPCPFKDGSSAMVVLPVVQLGTCVCASLGLPFVPFSFTNSTCLLFEWRISTLNRSTPSFPCMVLLDHFNKEGRTCRI